VRHDVTFPLYVEVEQISIWPVLHRRFTIIRPGWQPPDQRAWRHHMLGLAKRQGQDLPGFHSEDTGDPEIIRNPKATGERSIPSAPVLQTRQALCRNAVFRLSPAAQARHQGRPIFNTYGRVCTPTTAGWSATSSSSHSRRGLTIYGDGARRAAPAT